MKKLTLLIVLIVLMSVGMVRSDSTDTSAIMQISLLNQNPNPASVGDTTTLNFKIENLGGSAVNNLDIQVMEDYPFTIASGSAIENVGTLDAYQNTNDYINEQYTIKINKDANQGLYNLRLQYRVNNGIWIPAGTFAVDVQSKQYAQIIYIDKAKLDPGAETNITFTINNLGNAPLQNMVFSWEEPTGVILPVYSGASKYVKYLDIGQSVSLTYTVIADVNAKPGLYQLNLNLRAESINNATPSVISTKAGVFIGGVTDFDVAFSESTQGQTSLSVANTGNNPAQSVSVMIPQQDAFRVTGTNSAIIGNLDKGDYTIVSFQIVSTASMNFSGQGRLPGAQNFSSRLRNATSNNNPNNLRVIIEYTDTTGERRSVEKTVPIQFRALSSTSTNGYGSSRQQSSFFSSTLFYILLGVLVVAAAIVFGKKSIREKIFKKKK